MKVKVMYFRMPYGNNLFHFNQKIYIKEINDNGIIKTIGRLKKNFGFIESEINYFKNKILIGFEFIDYEKAINLKLKILNKNY